MSALLASSLLASSDGSGGASAAIVIIYVAFIVLVVVGMWKIFTKAGEEGWKAIIPFYNVYVLLKIVGRPAWWLILFLIPIVNFIVWIIIANDVSKSYGKGVGFTVGLVLLTPIFILILGFGDSRYVGPAAGGGQMAMAGGAPPPPPPAMPGGTPPPPPTPPPPHA
jgi:hypothetical protein